jgi:glycosyltransferase involved in cell wall biosynthesis
MKLLFISPSFYPATFYGGPSFLNRRMCEALSQHDDVDLKVLTTDADGPRRRIDLTSVAGGRTHGFAVIYCRRQLKPDISFTLLARLPGMIRRADVVHLNGVYSFTTLPALVLCRVMKKPVVWSTLGALQRWPGVRRGRAKRIFETACDELCEPGRVVIHVASIEEENESRLRITHAGRMVIRYGTDVPALDRDYRARGPALRLLYLGRLHPIKGIENLLPAMSQAMARTTLDICGEGEPSYEALLRSRVVELGLGERVRFHGAVSEAAKEVRFREADICVVPSFKESFGAVVTESLARAVPVITSMGTPWQEIEKIGCGLWVSNEPASLARAVDQAATMPLGEMGMRGREWMKHDFSWDNTTTKLLDLYRSLLMEPQSENCQVIADSRAA